MITSNMARGPIIEAEDEGTYPADVVVGALAPLNAFFVYQDGGDLDRGPFLLTSVQLQIPVLATPNASVVVSLYDLDWAAGDAPFPSDKLRWSVWVSPALAAGARTSPDYMTFDIAALSGGPGIMFKDAVSVSYLSFTAMATLPVDNRGWFSTLVKGYRL